MSDKIPIKIGQETKTSQQDIKKALNLNQVFSDQNSKPKPKKRSSLWLISIIILLLAILGLGVKMWLDSQKSFSSYQALIGPETKTAVVFKTEKLETLIGLAMVELKQDSGFQEWLKNQISDFLADSSVSFKNELIPALEDEAFFLVLPSDKTDFAWVAGGRVKTDQSFQAQKTIEKIVAGLRKHFGTNELLYRQNKINSAYSFSKINQPYYWSQVDEFILVSNDLEAIQTTIDRVIDK